MTLLLTIKKRGTCISSVIAVSGSISCVSKLLQFTSFMWNATLVIVADSVTKQLKGEMQEVRIYNQHGNGVELARWGMEIKVREDE